MSDSRTLSSNECTLANVERLLAVAVDGFECFEDTTDPEPSKPFAALEDALRCVEGLLAQQRNALETTEQYPCACPEGSCGRLMKYPNQYCRSQKVSEQQWKPCSRGIGTCPIDCCTRK